MTLFSERSRLLAVGAALVVYPMIVQADCAFHGFERICLTEYDTSACPLGEDIEAELQAQLDETCGINYVKIDDLGGGEDGCCYEVHYQCDDSLDIGDKGCW